MSRILKRALPTSLLVAGALLPPMAPAMASGPLYIGDYPPGYVEYQPDARVTIDQNTYTSADVARNGMSGTVKGLKAGEYHVVIQNDYGTVSQYYFFDGKHRQEWEIPASKFAKFPERDLKAKNVRIDIVQGLPDHRTLANPTATTWTTVR